MKNSTLCIVGANRELSENMPLTKDRDYIFIGYALWDLCKTDSMYLTKFPDGSYVSLIDIHTLHTRKEGYIPWLRKVPIYKYLQDIHPEIDMSIKYPLTEVIGYTRDKFTCSFDYMVAYAIYKGYKKIEVYGACMLLGDDGVQLENLDIWLDYAIFRKLEVVVQEESGLMQKPKRYGYEVDNTLGVYMQKHLIARKELIKLCWDLVFEDIEMIEDEKLLCDIKHRLLTIKENFEILYVDETKFKKEIYDRHGLKRTCIKCGNE